MGLALTNSTIDKYFGYLSKIDNDSKKKIIIKLTESIDFKESSKSDLTKLFGAWKDSRDSDEIIREIRDSRIDKHNNAEF